MAQIAFLLLSPAIFNPLYSWAPHGPKFLQVINENVISPYFRIFLVLGSSSLPELLIFRKEMEISN